MSDAAVWRSRQKNMSRGNVLVTGGAGYVGCHVAKALSQIGYIPVVFDNLSTGNADFVRFGPLERGDLRDAERLSQVFAQHGPIAVVHCATSNSEHRSAADPLSHYIRIAAGTLSLLEAMRRNAVTNLCLMSGASVYGDHSSLLVAEHATTNPLNAYGACLSAIENMTADFGQVATMNWVSLRLFSVAGADIESGLGEDHEIETSLVPCAIDATLGHRPFLPILGSHYATRDGSALRDYVHVCDVARAAAISVEKLLKGSALGPYNIGTGTDRTVLEIVAVIERLTGLKCPVRYEAKRLDVPYALSADVSRARDELGWVPTQSDIDTIIGSALVYRQALWERRQRDKSGVARLEEAAVIMHHESISDFAETPKDRDDILKKLDDFLER